MKKLLMLLITLLFISCTNNKERIRNVQEIYFIQNIEYQDSTNAKYTVGTKYNSAFYDLIHEEPILDKSKGIRIERDVFFFFAKPGTFNTGDTLPLSKQKIKIVHDTIFKTIKPKIFIKKDTLK